MTVHNLSSFHLQPQDISLLSKGLSYSPTPTFTATDHLFLLQQYDSFSNSVRKTYNPYINTRRLPQHQDSNELTSPFLFRKMKFLTNHNTVNTQPYSIPNIETYIYNTKDDLALQLPKLFEIKHQNITHKESKSLKILNKTNQITIKPADKNLGVVIMDTTDYLEQCLIHLSSETYQLLNSIPDSLHKDLENTVIKFKQEITRYNKLLYNYLLPHEKHRTPRFYGLPKIHKLSSKINKKKKKKNNDNKIK